MAVGSWQVVVSRWQRAQLSGSWELGAVSKAGGGDCDREAAAAAEVLSTFYEMNTSFCDFFTKTHFPLILIIIFQ